MDDLRIKELPEAGEGIVLKFENAAIRGLFNTFGKKYHEIVNTGLVILDMEVLDACLKYGTKNADGKPANIKFEQIDMQRITLDDLFHRVLDAYCLCVFGRDYLDQVKFLEQTLREEDEKRAKEKTLDSPPKSLEVSSASSDELLSGPGSTPPSSGV